MTKPPDLSGPNLKTIVHLLPHFRNDGNGVVNCGVDLACCQANSGFRIVCISRDGGAFAELLTNHRVAALVIKGTSVSTYMRGLHSVLKGLGPSIVHAHTVPTALAAKVLQPVLGFALVATAHNEPRLKSALLSVGDRIVCVSAAVATGMRRLGVSEAKLRIVRNGPLGSARRPARAAEARSASSPNIITVGGLHHTKGVQDLIQAFSMARKTVPGLSLSVVGHGPANLKLRRQAERLGCDASVRFLGFLDDPRPLLASADVFVLASHREAFGLALAEAREAGCAVIATRVGGIPEVLENGRAGILVPARNPGALSRELVKLLTDEAELRDWQARARANLEWLRVERVSREMLALYDGVIGDFQSGRSRTQQSASLG